MSVVVTIGIIGFMVWLWADTLRARELAFKVCNSSCRQMDVQLLDQTVQLASMSLGRTDQGRINIRRYYGFEFSVDGIDRRQGGAALLGSGVEYVQLDHPDGLTIIETNGRRDRRAF